MAAPASHDRSNDGSQITESTGTTPRSASCHTTWLAHPLALACVLWLSPSSLLAQHSSADHSAFDRLLRQNVVNGKVDYDGFDRAPEFQRYLSLLDATDPATLPDKERLA